MSELVDRFVASMVMDFDKWHDGIGYDVELIDEMSADERKAVEQKLISKLDDWRDLEALDRLGTPAAHAAIEKARQSSNAELRLKAQDYGPDPHPDLREAAIIAGLSNEDLSDGLSEALDQAADHPTPNVIAALLKCARDTGGPGAYDAAAVLYQINGKIESHFGFENREFFLRFVDVGTDDHQATVGLQGGEVPGQVRAARGCHQ